MATRKSTLSSLLSIGLAAQLHAAPAPSAAPSPPVPIPGSIESQPGWPAAKNAGDVDSVEHLVAALYDVISGPAGKQRDWDRFRALFLPDGRLGTIRPDTPEKDGTPARKSDVFLRTPQLYAERNDPYFKTNGFFERSIANRIEVFGNLTHVWSTYESRHAVSDAKPFARGVNSLQIAHAQGRYWIASIIWDDERPGLSLPQKYLSGQ
jgi:hypothetical protein